jgi:putative ABC transport system permease protein
MFKNYLKLIYRNLLRQKLYTGINILGLSIGLTCCILIGLYVVDELSYDKYQKNYDRIYRVVLHGKFGTSELEGPIAPAPLAEAMLRDIPEIEKAFRIYIFGTQAIIHENKLFYQNDFFYADSTLLTEFHYDFLEGDPAKALSRPNSMIITKEIAQKYFGKEKALGKILFLKYLNHNYQVTGVVDDLSGKNTHFRFKFLASLNSLPDSRSNFWLNNNYFTYILVKPGVDPKKLEAKINDLVIKYSGPDVTSFLNASIADFFKAGNKLGYTLEKLSDIHLYSKFDFQLDANGDITYVYIFIAVAIFILIIACVNFINLATARSANRAKEVGLRKVFGSGKGQLIAQFLIDSTLLCLISVILSVSMVELLLKPFNSMLQLQLDLSIFYPLYLIGLLILLTIVVSFLAGFYPSLYLSSFKPAEVLKGKLRTGVSGSWLRNILVIVQFTIGIFILLCTFLISNQLEYIQKKKLGYDKENLIVIERTDPIRNKIKVFMDELRSNPLIDNLSLSSAVPGRVYNHNGIMVEGLPMTDTKMFTVYGTDYDYAKTMDIRMVAGRYFRQDFATDTSAIVINEAGAKILGIKDPVGKRLILPSSETQKRHMTIVGIMKDFNFESLHKPIQPILIFANLTQYDGYITVHVQKGKTGEVLDYLNKTWKKYTLESPLTFFFFDQEFEKMYKKEFQTRKIMSVFTFLAIITACLGLLGLIAFTSERRTKEIGVRKAIGSSTLNLILVLSYESLRLVAISSIAASVLAYFAIKLWLRNFAYRMDINWMVFVLATILALSIALVTIILVTIKAARKNPVEALRFE